MNFTFSICPLKSRATSLTLLSNVSPAKGLFILDFTAVSYQGALNALVPKSRKFVLNFGKRKPNAFTVKELLKMSSYYSTKSQSTSIYNKSNPKILLQQVWNFHRNGFVFTLIIYVFLTNHYTHQWL